jgi:hypothetical protein
VQRGDEKTLGGALLDIPGNETGKAFGSRGRETHRAFETVLKIDLNHQMALTLEKVGEAESDGLAYIEHQVKIAQAGAKPGLVPHVNGVKHERGLDDPTITQGRLAAIAAG